MQKRRYLYMLVIIAMLVTLLSFSMAQAEEPGATITLPGGVEIPLDGLTGPEKQKMMTFMDKVAKTQLEKSKLATEASKVMAEVISDPVKLDSWRKLITGTIKDICEDLNVSVNEFIKTPAGAGVAALIIYKIAGKEVLSAVADVFLIIPFWFIMMGVLFYLQKKYLGSIVMYKQVWTPRDEKHKAKEVKESPERVLAYPWASKEARATFACVLYGSMMVVTLITLIIAF
jgi:hypothetical protein